MCAQVPSTSYTITLTPTVLPDEMFYVNLGDGAASIQGNYSGGVITSQPYALPGNYTIVGKILISTITHQELFNMSRFIVKKVSNFEG